MKKKRTDSTEHMHTDSTEHMHTDSKEPMHIDSTEHTVTNTATLPGSANL